MGDWIISCVITWSSKLKLVENVILPGNACCNNGNASPAESESSSAFKVFIICVDGACMVKRMNVVKDECGLR